MFKLVLLNLTVAQLVKNGLVRELGQRGSRSSRAVVGILGSASGGAGTDGVGQDVGNSLVELLSLKGATAQGADDLVVGALEHVAEQLLLLGGEGGPGGGLGGGSRLSGGSRRTERGLREGGHRLAWARGREEAGGVDETAVLDRGSDGEGSASQEEGGDGGGGGIERFGSGGGGWEGSRGWCAFGVVIRAGNGAGRRRESASRDGALPGTRHAHTSCHGKGQRSAQKQEGRSHHLGSRGVLLLDGAGGGFFNGLTERFLGVGELKSAHVSSRRLEEVLGHVDVIVGLSRNQDSHGQAPRDHLQHADEEDGPKDANSLIFHHDFKERREKKLDTVKQIKSASEKSNLGGKKKRPFSLIFNPK